MAGHAKYADIDENRELLSLYARRLVGRAAVICKTPAEFLSVRHPIREALAKVPDVEHLGKNSTEIDQRKGVVRLLIDACTLEMQEYATRECVDIRTHYQSICREMHKDSALWKKEEEPCKLVALWPEMMSKSRLRWCLRPE